MRWIERLLRRPVCEGCECASYDAFCADCDAALERWPGAEAVFVYDGPVQHVVLGWKERGRSAAVLWDRVAQEALPSADIVVPVPPAFLRTFRRGFHPPDDFARLVARRIGARMVGRALARLDSTAQMGRGALARRTRGPMFRATARATGLRGKKVLLVDDVRTTGTTLKEAQRALADAGVMNVHTLALAAAL